MSSFIGSNTHVREFLHVPSPILFVGFGMQRSENSLFCRAGRTSRAGSGGICRLEDAIVRKSTCRYTGPAPNSSMILKLGAKFLNSSHDLVWG